MLPCSMIVLLTSTIRSVIPLRAASCSAVLTLEKSPVFCEALGDIPDTTSAVSACKYSCSRTPTTPDPLCPSKKIATVCSPELDLVYLPA